MWIAFSIMQGKCPVILGRFSCVTLQTSRVKYRLNVWQVATENHLFKSWQCATLLDIIHFLRWYILCSQKSLVSITTPFPVHETEMGVEFELVEGIASFPDSHTYLMNIIYGKPIRGAWNGTCIHFSCYKCMLHNLIVHNTAYLMSCQLNWCFVAAYTLSK